MDPADALSELESELQALAPTPHGTLIFPNGIPIPAPEDGQESRSDSETFRASLTNKSQAHSTVSVKPEPLPRQSSPYQFPSTSTVQNQELPTHPAIAALARLAASQALGKGNELPSPVLNSPKLPQSPFGKPPSIPAVALPQSEVSFSECAGCGQGIFGVPAYSACKKSWHREHLNCAVCGTNLAGTGNIFESGDRPLCARDYYRSLWGDCGYCHQPIEQVSSKYAP